MIYAFIGLFALSAIVLSNAGAVLLGRWAAARCLRLPGRPFWPFPASRSGPPIGVSRRALLAASGFVVAYVLAALLHAGGLHSRGITVSEPRELSAFVNPVVGSVAAVAGVRPGDRILGVAEEPISTWEELKATLNRHAGQTVDVAIQRGTARLSVTMTISPQGRIGVTAVPETRPVSVAEALGSGFLVPLQLLRVAARGFFDDRAELSGPVAIVAESSSAPERRRDGFTFFTVLNSTYGLLFALVFSIVLGLRRPPEPRSLGETGEKGG